VPPAPEQIADGLWRWTARHPEWHPGDFGSEVASFALTAGDETILVDPLLPPEPDAVLDLIERGLGERLAMLITIPYHVRSSEQLRHRFRGQVETTIWGHPACRKRLSEDAGFRAFEPGDELPAGASAHKIGTPRRHALPAVPPSARLRRRGRRSRR
jgi:hypothetical protein